MGDFNYRGDTKGKFFNLLLETANLRKKTILF